MHRRNRAHDERHFHAANGQTVGTSAGKFDPAIELLLRSRCGLPSASSMTSIPLSQVAVDVSKLRAWSWLACSVHTTPLRS